MEAGILNEIVTVMREYRDKNKLGELVINHNHAFRARAGVKVNGGNRAVENNEMVFNQTIFVTMRMFYADRILPTDRIVWRSRPYRIITISPERMKQRVVITCELINE